MARTARQSLTGCRCGSLWDFVGLSILTRRECLTGNRLFQFVKKTYLDVSKLIPGETRYSVVFANVVKFYRVDTNAVLQENEDPSCKLCKMDEDAGPRSLFFEGFDSLFSSRYRFDQKRLRDSEFRDWDTYSFGRRAVPVSKMGKSLYVGPKTEMVREDIRKGTWCKNSGGGAQLSPCRWI